MIELTSDSIKIAGPRVDGNYTITLNVGEWQAIQIAKLLAVPTNTPIVWVGKPKEE